MKKYLFLLCLPAMLAWAFTSCSDEDKIGDGDDGNNLTETVINKRLTGEWICYYQYWEESDYQEEAYYTDDGLSLTFYDDSSAYLKREGKDELLEIGSSQDFIYEISGGIIHAYIYGEETLWNIISLTETELVIKWQDGDYIIMAKFVKRASLSGKVSGLSFQTEYNSDAPSDYTNYSLSYDFKGELKGITCNNKILTYEPCQDNEMYMNWYDGKKLKLVDNKENGYAELFLNNSSIAYAKYDRNGFLTDIVSGENVINYEYSNGNLVSWELWMQPANYLRYKYEYEYSKEKNDANIDLNYFIDVFSISEGNSFYATNYWEAGLAGKKSDNLVSKVFIPNEGYDIYYTYSYERDAEGRISKIIRLCNNRYDGEWLNRSTINVGYYSE